MSNSMVYSNLRYRDTCCMIAWERCTSYVKLQNANILQFSCVGASRCVVWEGYETLVAIELPVRNDSQHDSKTEIDSLQ